jgi:hypothetical protein
MEQLDDRSPCRARTHARRPTYVGFRVARRIREEARAGTSESPPAARNESASLDDTDSLH